MLVRAVREPSHYLRNTSAHPPRGRCARAPLFTGDPRATVSHCIGHRAGPVVDLHALCARTDGVAIGDAARALSGNLQPRVFHAEGLDRSAGPARANAGNCRCTASRAALMESAGLWMLLTVGLMMVTTGLPAWMLLIGVAMVFCIIGLAA